MERDTFENKFSYYMSNVISSSVCFTSNFLFLTKSLITTPTMYPPVGLCLHQPTAVTHLCWNSYFIPQLSSLCCFLVYSLCIFWDMFRSVVSTKGSITPSALIAPWRSSFYQSMGVPRLSTFYWWWFCSDLYLFCVRYYWKPNSILTSLREWVNMLNNSSKSLPVS